MAPYDEVGPGVPATELSADIEALRRRCAQRDAHTVAGSIVITGSAGLIGSALRPALQAAGWAVRGVDLRAGGAGDEQRGDVRSARDVEAALRGARGVVHLAAVSRVVWGERDPARCRETNVQGTRTVLEAALAMRPRPWVILASSREVYGQPASLPATEDAPLRPINTYGRSKVAAEKLVAEACDAGLRACTLRLSNAYGSASDHPDRVVPAFIGAALGGGVLRVEGADRCFDFTHLDDVVAGLLATIRLLTSGAAAPPPIQLVTGQPTTLGQLAELVLALAGGATGAHLEQAPARSYDVARFYGSAERAARRLGWRARVPLREGLARLIAALQRPATATPSNARPRGSSFSGS